VYSQRIPELCRKLTYTLYTSLCFFVRISDAAAPCVSSPLESINRNGVYERLPVVGRHARSSIGNRYGMSASKFAF
jgi:hypothetical protein